MGKAKSVFVELELSEDGWKKIDRLAKKSGLKQEKVANLIIGAELDIIQYQVRRRKRLAKRLKTRFPKRVLYMKSFGV